MDRDIAAGCPGPWIRSRSIPRTCISFSSPQNHTTLEYATESHLGYIGSSAMGLTKKSWSPFALKLEFAPMVASRPPIAADPSRTLRTWK